MSELDNNLLNEITLGLRERQSILRDEINKALTAQGQQALDELRGQGHDRGDESVADMLADLNIAALSAEADELENTEQALLRIDAGTYGRCLDCQVDISRERLEAFPVAKRCLDCQTKHENYRGGKDVTPSL